MCIYRRTNDRSNFITDISWGDEFMGLIDYSLTQSQYDDLVALLSEIQTEDFFKLPDEHLAKWS
jgi:hypothetical protein